MNWRILTLAGTTALLAGAALADDPMMNTYDNTVVTKNQATGQSGMLLFGRDMTYTAKAVGADGKPVQYTGAWSLKNGGQTICLAPNVPAGTANAPKPSCSPLTTHNVGDSWTVTDDQNNTFQVSITAGR